MSTKSFKVRDCWVILFASGAIQIDGKSKAHNDLIFKYLQDEGFIERNANPVLIPQPAY
jgi:hypothetical protein